MSFAPIAKQLDLIKWMKKVVKKNMPKQSNPKSASEQN